MDRTVSLISSDFVLISHLDLYHSGGGSAFILFPFSDDFKMLNVEKWGETS